MQKYPLRQLSAPLIPNTQQQRSSRPQRRQSFPSTGCSVDMKAKQSETAIDARERIHYEQQIDFLLEEILKITREKQLPTNSSQMPRTRM
jgi:hypothetical protein